MVLMPDDRLDEPVGRTLQTAVGIVCAAIALLFIVFALWFGFSACSIGKLFHLFPLSVLGISIAFASFFSTVSVRLCTGHAARKKSLFGNFALSMFGCFFIIVPILLYADYKMGGRAEVGEVRHWIWVGLANSVIAGIAALKLSKKRKSKSPE